MTQMVTTCPACKQQLAVTAADLRVGQGYVRCGRCDKVFNALVTLTEEPGNTAPAAEDIGVAHGTQSLPALDESEALPPIPGREGAAIPFGSGEDEIEVVETHSTGEFESIVLEGDQPAPEEAAIEAVREELVQDEIARQAGSSMNLLPAEQRAQLAAVAAAAADPSEALDFDAHRALGNRRRAAGAGWVIAAVLLLLVLAGQVIHLNRHALVTVPWLQQPISSVYGLFGRSVDPPWDLAQYEVNALGGTELRGDARSVVLHAAVAVRATAPWPQPPPLIRVELTDQFGNALATQALAPREWLLGDAPSRMAPGQRLDAQLTLAAPGQVSSYTLTACLNDDAGRLRCFGDLK